MSHFQKTKTYCWCSIVSTKRNILSRPPRTGTPRERGHRPTSELKPAQQRDWRRLPSSTARKRLSTKSTMRRGACLEQRVQATCRETESKRAILEDIPTKSVPRASTPLPFSSKSANANSWVLERNRSSEKLREPRNFAVFWPSTGNCTRWHNSAPTLMNSLSLLLIPRSTWENLISPLQRTGIWKWLIVARDTILWWLVLSW